MVEMMVWPSLSYNAILQGINMENSGFEVNIIAATFALLCAGTGLFSMVAIAAVTTVALARIARARIGGQTGDILGASQQLAEAAALAMAAAHFT